VAVRKPVAASFRSDVLLSRRASLAYVALAGLSVPNNALALEPEVPIRVQIALLDRVIPFDRNFAVRVHGGELSLAVIVDDQSLDSVRVGAQLLSELSSVETLGGFKIRTSRVAFSSGQALIEECRRLRAGIVCVSPGLREPPSKLAAMLQGLRVLSVGSMPEQAPQGLVLGSAVRSGKPRVLVNLAQAKRQEVDFRADFLRMVEVVG
jgi:YfiR/HmsC-like